ncbi:MAG: sulfatase-like hydrolase/transferase [Thermoanaerobaculia bacterium]
MLVVGDTLRWDHTSLGGYGRNTTPQLAARAKRGVVLPRAYSQFSVTWPTLASLFTGRPFGRLHRAGEFVLLGEATKERAAGLQAGVTTLAERLAASGVSTIAVVGNPLLRRGGGFDQGFATYLGTRELAGTEEEALKVDGLLVSRAALEAIRGARERARDRPFFAWVHYFDPHRPYLPPAEDLAALGLPATSPAAAIRDGMARDRSGALAEFAFPEESGWLDGTARARLVALYDAEVRHFDRALEALLAGLEREGLLETTDVVVTGDHGEAFYEEGFWGHGMLSKEPEERVPLVLLPAGGQRPKIADPEAPVSTTDVYFSTLARFAVHAAPDPLALPWTLDLFSGRRFATRVFSEGQNVQVIRDVRHALYRYEGIARHHAAVAARGLLPAADGLALYDLAVDPGERRDLFAAEPDRAREIARDLMAPPLRAFFLESPEGSVVGDAKSLDPELERELRALGYLH